MSAYYNHLGQVTRMHWHGIRVPGWADGGPPREVLPGETWFVEFPVNNPAATFWYHPHPDGLTAEQANFGVAGAIVVRDSVEAALDLPRSYGVDDLPVVIQDAKGTIAREQALPDHIGENDTLLANANVCKINLTTKDVEEGQRLYNIYCGICHGSALDGNGPLYSSGKFIAMPANLKSGEKYLSMSAGRIYHGIVYGKNAMGSYASQLDTKQRWQVVAYIKKIQSENGGAPFTMVTEAPVVKDSVQVSAAEPKEVKEHK